LLIFDGLPAEEADIEHFQIQGKFAGLKARYIQEEGVSKPCFAGFSSL